MKKILFLCFICVACHECPHKVPPYTRQEFNGREEYIAYGQTIRRPVYAAKVPLSWKRIDPLETESLSDTKKPIISFDLNHELLVTVHTFPTSSLEERIPPEAQVERWKQQVKSEEYKIERLSQGGFVGLYFEASSENTTVCAWSLQLDLDHYQTLHFLAASVEEEEHYKQMAADYTIKVTGNSQSLEKHRNELLLFAESFELIQEIPIRS